MNPHFAAPSRQPVLVAVAGQVDTQRTTTAHSVRAVPTSSASQPHRTNAPHQRHHSEGSSSSHSSWRLHQQELQLQNEPSSSRPQHVRSKSIPIHPITADGAGADGGGGEMMRRSPSEQRLHDDEAMADYRDLIMFRRIAEGIRRQQRDTTHFHPRMVNDMCLASIIDTRNSTDDELVRHRQSSIMVDRARGGDDDYYDNDHEIDKGGGDEAYEGISSHHRSILSRRSGGAHPRGHRDAKTTSYLDPSTCKWIISPALHHHHHHHLSSSAAAFSDALSSHSASTSSPEDEMLFPLDL